MNKVGFSGNDNVFTVDTEKAILIPPLGYRIITGVWRTDKIRNPFVNIK